MKRVSILAVLAVAALALTATVGAGSASATALCSSAPATYHCPVDDTYRKGTEITSSLAPGTEVTFATEGGEVVNKCSSSTFNMAITNGGGEGPVEGTPSIAFGSCTKPVTVGTMVGKQRINWRKETHNGALSPGPNFTMEVFGISCTYQFNFTGPTLFGGASPTISYNKESLFKVTGSSFFCPSPLRETATYNISSPTPLYVEQY